MDHRHAILSLDYEAQHFGFHPRTLVDSVYNVFFENVLSSLTQLKQYLIQEYKDIPPSVININTDSMLQELVQLCDKSVDKLEVYLNSNVFCIDPQAVLPEDNVHVTSPCTKEKDENIDKEIEESKRKILEEKAKRFCLKKTIIEQRQVKERLLLLQNELKYLLKIALSEDVNKENIEFLYSRLNNFSNRLEWIPFTEE